MPRHELYLTTDRGVRLAVLDYAGGFTYTRVCNAIGSFSVSLPPTFDKTLIRKDRRVEFWRAADGQRLGLEMIGFIRGINYKTDAQGKTTIAIRGPDVNDLLRRRIVAYAAGTAQAQMTDQADDMLKAIVHDNLESDAAAARDLSAYSFSVAPDLAAGTSITKGFAWRPLITVLQDICADQWARGTELFFDVVMTTPTVYQFQTWINQRGADHSFPSGIAPVVFGLEFGNLEEPEYDEDAGQEVTYVYGGGQGEGSTRLTSEVEDTTRSGESIFNRCEAFQDARNEASSAAVQAAAYQRLAQGKPVKRFRGKLRDTDGCKYGRNWTFGDRVTATYEGMQFDGVIRAVTIRVDSSGKETLDARLEVLA